MQKTRFNNFQDLIGVYLSTSFIGPWKRRSIGLISLLIGYYLGSNLTVYFLQSIGQRAIVSFIMFLIIELLIRVRTNVNKFPLPIYWLAIDNIRIGSIFSVVLEAFKLGS